jgi:ribulose 1,5-bisphosphate synthetase/thiazole synthase
MQSTVEVGERPVPVLAKADVLVVGGGVSGVAAAVSAARAGARAVLLERQGYLGGVATAGLMTSATNCAMTADGRQVVKGIFEEIMDELAARGATCADWRTRALPQFPFDQEAFRVLLIDLVQDAGVEVLVETWASDAVVQGGKLQGVIVEAKGGRVAITARVTVDATGDADLVAFAGAPCRDAPPDSGSLLFQMRGVDLDETVTYFERHPEEWPQYSDRVTPLEDFLANWRHRDMFHLPHGGGRGMCLVQDAIARGDYIRERGPCTGLDVLGMYAYRGSGAVLINSCNFRIDHLDVRSHSQAELQARQLVPVIAGFLRAHMPGFEHAVVSETADVVGVRFTRWIDAGFDLTPQDLAGDRPFEDVIGTQAAQAPHPRGGVVYLDRIAELPYRIMLPQGVDNLIVGSGKSVSTQPRGLVRGQVPCYVLGQAAGVAAAIAARTGKACPELDVRNIQRELLRQNVYLGDRARLSALGLG